MIRRLAVTTLTAVALLGAPLALSGDVALTASAAATYPVTTAPGTVSRSTVAAGGAVTFSGEGFRPGTAVTIGVSQRGDGGRFAAPIPASVAGVVHADAAGRYTVTLTLTVPGRTTLTATGLAPDGATLEDVAFVTVLSSGSSGGNGSGGSGGNGSGSNGAGGNGSGAGGGSNSLPRTGADNVASELWIAGGLLTAGGAGLVVSKSRRRPRSQA